MALNPGMIYNESLVGKRESVVDEILLLNPDQTPLINLLGFSQPVTQVEHIWFEDTMFANRSTVAGAVDGSATSIVVASVEPFRERQVAQIGEELVLVTAVDKDTKTLTVVRGYAGTTAAPIADGDTIEALFVEGAEGSDARQARFKPRTRVSNITQIFDDSIRVTGTAQVVTQYGISDIYGYERQKKMLEQALALENALINGIKYENGDVRQMAGMRSFIKSNVANGNGAALNADMINDQLQAIFEAGGFNGGGTAGYKIMVPAKQKRAISAFDNNKLYITQAENSRGTVVDFFVSDFGRFEIVLNNNLKPSELFIFDTNRTDIRPLVDREFSHKYLGDKGDYVEGMIVGEYTLQFEQEAAHARIANLG